VPTTTRFVGVARRTADAEVRALDGVDLTVDDGDSVAITGPSGSGKSTMMNIVGCLDVPTEGRYLLDGVEVSKLSDDQLADIRSHKIGLVFQSNNLERPRSPTSSCRSCAASRSCRCRRAVRWDC
jgi:putative ABC transport system ATP-binding protein